MCAVPVTANVPEVALLITPVEVVPSPQLIVDEYWLGKAFGLASGEGTNLSCERHALDTGHGRRRARRKGCVADCD